MRISDWSSDVCSSDLGKGPWKLSRLNSSAFAFASARSLIATNSSPQSGRSRMARATRRPMRPKPLIATFTAMSKNPFCGRGPSVLLAEPCQDLGGDSIGGQAEMLVQIVDGRRCAETVRSEEHTSELQSLMRISYAVF